MKRISKLITAALLCGCLSILGISAAEAAEGTFEINSAEDLRRFSENCKTNTWSDGLTVELNADLDLGNGPYVGSIAYFNGTFRGNSHKIVNLESQRPLFQTIGPEGRVSDLRLSATIDSTRDNTAALVSENNGTLEKISVDALVSGKSTAGLLSAVNNGIISTCEVSGVLTADNSVGSIAGKNQGYIDSCVNRAHVNTNVDDSSIGIDGIRDIMENILLTKSLNNAENLRTRIDVGGIAGFNMNGGTVINCTNEGIVGYPHNGFNIGGICGRSGGVVENCVNSGNVFGRRGTGGIVGKQQPEINLDFSQDVLSSMSDEMDGINSLITDTLNTTENISESTYSRLSGLSRSMTDVKNSTNVIYNASLDRFDEVADEVNSTTDTLVGAAEDIAADTEGLDESFDDLSRMTRQIDASADDMTEAFGLTAEERGRLLSLNEQLKNDLNTTLPFTQEVENNLLPLVPEERRARISQGLGEINRMAGDIRAMRTMLFGLRNTRDRIADGSVGVEANQRDKALSAGVSGVLDSLGDLDDALSEFSSFASSLGGTISGAAGSIDINLKANETVRNAGNDIYAGLDSISGQLDSMNAGAREDSLEVIRNLNEINSRFTRLTDLMKNERDRLNDIADNGGIFVDNSTDVDSASRIVSCRNMADISGDSLTGGIAGTIGVEYDLDPDEDILRTNDRSLDYSFGVSAAIFNSVNAGGVSARANHAGGITGKADLGYLRMNTNEGDVTSEDGYFIGGIAGYSEATLEGNTARCRVTGKKNTGGICGYGKELWDNRAAVTVLGTEEYAGTIAGNVDSLDPENLRNNRYYSGNFGAIDDIDYAGMAEKAEAPLDTFLVKFLVNGRLAGLEEVKAGTILKDIPYPEVEEREGFYLRLDKDPETVINEDTVVDSLYCLPLAALPSEEKSPGTNKPLLIVDGQFREGDALTYRKEGTGHYFVTIPDDGLAERQVRVLKPVSRNPFTKKKARSKVSVTVNGNPAETETFGDYLVFRTGDRDLEIVVTHEELPFRTIAAVLAVVLAALVIFIISAIVKRRKKNPPKPKKAKKKRMGLKEALQKIKEQEEAEQREAEQKEAEQREAEQKEAEQKEAPAAGQEDS